MPSFATPPPDPETVKRKPQVRAILLEALKRADIPAFDADINNYQSEYWRTIKIGDDDVVEIHITKHSWGAGYLTLNLYPDGLAEFTVSNRSNDEEATNALADAITYIKFAVSQVLGETSQLLSLRGINDYSKRHPSEYADGLRDWYEVLGKPIRRGYEKARKEMQQRLAGEAIRTRGGSSTKLSPEDRQSIHVTYDAIHKIAKHIKTDYNATFADFQRTHRKQGWNRAQWRTHWEQYGQQKYPAEMQELIVLFAADDDPSASDVAMTFIANRKSHKKSYLRKLITASRKAVKK